MKVWKKNLVAAAILVAVCAGIYVNWKYTEDQAVMNFADTLDEEKLMSEDTLVMSDGSFLNIPENTDTMTDYFAAVRLSRQQARDNAVSLLQEAMAYDEDTEAAQDIVARAKHLHETIKSFDIQLSFILAAREPLPPPEVAEAARLAGFTQLNPMRYFLGTGRGT